MSARPTERRTRDAFERPLPYSSSAERSVLGAVLLDNSKLAIAREKLLISDFFLDQHRRVFERMAGLADAQQPIDLVTLSESLERCGQLEAAGGAAYLSELMDGLPRATNVGEYARIVKEKAVLRQFIRTAEAIQQRALDGDGSRKSGAAGGGVEGRRERLAPAFSPTRSLRNCATTTIRHRELSSTGRGDRSRRTRGT